MSGWAYLDRSFLWIHPEMEDFTFTPADTAHWIYPGSMEKLMRQLAQHPPELFIDGNVAGEWPFGTKYPIASFPEVQAYLDHNYSLETTVRGYRIFRLRPRNA